MPDNPNRPTLVRTVESEATIASAVQANGATPPPGLTAEDINKAATSATAADADINALWINPGVGDPLTAVHLHRIPVGKPKDFFRLCRCAMRCLSRPGPACSW
jgi:hypothetical protein